MPIYIYHDIILLVAAIFIGIVYIRTRNRITSVENIALLNFIYAISIVGILLAIWWYK